MTTPPNDWPRFSVQTWRGGGLYPGRRLVLCRVVGRDAGHMVRRHVNGSTMIGSPGVAEANPGQGDDGWGPWEPWDPDGLMNETERRRLHALVSEPATRADLEAAEPLDLLLLLAALWRSMLMGADEPVVAPWIDGLALATIHAAGTRPAWLDEGAAMDELRRPLRAALVKLGEALGVGELEHNAGAWVERGWTAEDGAWWLSSRADAWIRARWGDEAAPAAPARADWAAFNAGQASAWSLVRIWIDPERPGPIPSPLVAWLADELWAREVLPRLKREHQRAAIVPALTVRTMGLAVLALSPATVERVNGGRRELVGPNGRPVAFLEDDDVARALVAFRGAVPVETARAVADELMQARQQLASLMGFIHAAFEATELARQGAGSTARWDTWPRWAEDVGDLWGVRATPSLRGDLYRVAWWGNLAQLHLFDGRTQRGLWTLTAPDPFKRGRPTIGASRAVVLNYAPVLFPEWAAMENPGPLVDGRPTNRGVRLLALPNPAELPTGTRDPSVKGRLFLYSFDLLAALAAAGDPELGSAWTRADAERQRQRVGLAHDVAEAQVRALKDAGLIEEAPGDRLRLASPDARRLATPRAGRKGRDGKR